MGCSWSTVSTRFVSHLGTFVTVVAGDPQSLKTASVRLHYAQAGVNVSAVRNFPNQNPTFFDQMTPAIAASIKKA
jgi:hypothetical protein